MAAQRLDTSQQVILGKTPETAWVQSPLYDLGCFILSPLLGLAWLLTDPGPTSILAVLAVLGIPHYLSTFTFYGWEENWHYYRTRWLAFFFGPMGLILVITVLSAYRIPYVLQLAVYAWNTYHVARQSCGILSIYRHRMGVFDPLQKRLANTAIIASNGCMAAWQVHWQPILHRPLARLLPALPTLLWLSLGIVAVIALVRLSISWWQRRAHGNTPGLPEVSCLCTSLLLFHPYLWVQNGAQATTAMLIGHFIQYLGLVWLLQRRKWRQQTTTLTPSWLVYLSQHTRMLLLIFLTTAGLYLLLKYLFTRLALTFAFDTALFMLVFMHFYLDRLFWAFKEPQIRQVIGPYLMAGTVHR